MSNIDIGSASTKSKEGISREYFSNTLAGGCCTATCAYYTSYLGGMIRSHFPGAAPAQPPTNRVAFPALSLAQAFRAHGYDVIVQKAIRGKLVKPLHTIPHSKSSKLATIQSEGRNMASE